MIASILVINKFNRYNKENLAEAICNSAQFLFINTWTDVYRNTCFTIYHMRNVDLALD